MNLEAQLQTLGFRAQLAVSGRVFIHVLTKKSFKGVLEPVPAISPDTIVMGLDPREESILHVLNADCPPIAANDRLQDPEAYTQQTLVPPNPPLPPNPANPQATAPVIWKVTNRDDNPGDVLVRYTIVKVTDSDS